MILKASFCILAGAFLLAACTPSNEETVALSPEEEARLIEDSREIVLSLMQQLSAELKSALQSEGVAPAIQVCQEVAQPITSEISENYPDMRILRTALRYRNPENAPDADSSQILQRWTALVAATGKPPKPVVSQTADAIIVHHPIMMAQQACLTCHGDPDALSPEVTESLTALYPDDQATGFELGDLRGAFRVELTP
jgi:mono/diheme cytochrome c family protein